MFLHWRKVAVIMQQPVTAFDAERADDDVGGLADGDAEFPKPAIIPCGARSEVGIQKRYHDLLVNTSFDTCRVEVIPSTLQDFEQHAIADQKRFPRRRGFKLGSRRRATATQMRDPHGTVDENHDPA